MERILDIGGKIPECHSEAVFLGRQLFPPNHLRVETMREPTAQPNQDLHNLPNREVVVADQMGAARREVSHDVRAHVPTTREGDGVACNPGAREASPILLAGRVDLAAGARR